MILMRVAAVVAVALVAAAAVTVTVAVSAAVVTLPMTKAAAINQPEESESACEGAVAREAAKSSKEARTRRLNLSRHPRLRTSICIVKASHLVMHKAAAKIHNREAHG